MKHGGQNKEKRKKKKEKYTHKGEQPVRFEEPQRHCDTVCFLHRYGPGTRSAEKKKKERKIKKNKANKIGGREKEKIAKKSAEKMAEK